MRPRSTASRSRDMPPSRSCCRAPSCNLVPDPAHNAASLLAVIAMIDPASPQGQHPVTADLLGSTDVQRDLANFAGNDSQQ